MMCIRQVIRVLWPYGAREEALALNVIQMEDKDKLIIKKGQTKPLSNLSFVSMFVR